jgi:hypothetical protein
LVQDRGGAEFQTGGILLYAEDLKRGTNKDIGPKDIFEIASNILSSIDLSRLILYVSESILAHQFLNVERRFGFRNHFAILQDFIGSSRREFDVFIAD